MLCLFIMNLLMLMYILPRVTWLFIWLKSYQTFEPLTIDRFKIFYMEIYKKDRGWFFWNKTFTITYILATITIFIRKIWSKSHSKTIKSVIVIQFILSKEEKFNILMIKYENIDKVETYMNIYSYEEVKFFMMI